MNPPKRSRSFYAVGQPRGRRRGTGPESGALGRAQPPRTSAPRGGAVQALQPRQLHRDHLVGAAMVANVCLIFAVCVWISIFAASCPLLVVLLPLSTATFVPHAREAWVTYRAPFWDSAVALSNPFSAFRFQSLFLNRIPGRFSNELLLFAHH